MATALIDERELQSLGSEVAVGDIDAELYRFFSGGEGAPDNPVGIARASLLNLAVYTEDSASVSSLTATIEELTREAACRAILILAEPAGAPAVRSWVQAHCRLSERGEKTVCTEQVSFLLTGANASLVRNTVFAHLDSDLPLIFWWRGELSDVFEERLYSRLDRFIFDSSQWSQPGDQFLRLNAAVKESGNSFVTHDLAYTRSHPMRTAIARVFDDPVARQALGQLESFEIDYVPGQRISALWLAAWIAGRLGATLDSKMSSSDRFVFQTEKQGTFSILCREGAAASEGENPCDSLRGVRIHLGSAGAIRIGHAEEASDFWRIRWQLAEASDREKLFPCRARSEADLVAEILIRAGRNRAMGDAMSTLRQLIVL